MADEGECGHEMCSCQSVIESGYCSDHCRDAADQDMVEIRCDCGHPGCGTA